MKQLRLILMVAVIGLMLPLGVFAQKGKNSNRPPKDQDRIVDKEKKDKPPRNSNRGRPD